MCQGFELQADRIRKTMLMDDDILKVSLGALSMFIR